MKHRMLLKDKILQQAYGRTCANPQTIEEDEDAVQTAITALHNEGLIKILHKGNNRGQIIVTCYEITPAGTELMDNGGYAKQQSRQKRRELSSKVWAMVGFVLGVVTTKIVEKVIDILFQ